MSVKHKQASIELQESYAAVSCGCSERQDHICEIYEELVFAQVFPIGLSNNQDG
jgi:hypothetical protein